MDRRAEAPWRPSDAGVESDARTAPRTCRADRSKPGLTKSKIDQISERRFFDRRAGEGQSAIGLQALGRAGVALSGFLMF